MNIIHKIWAVVKYCADAIKKGAIVLYLVIKSDVMFLWGHLLKRVQSNQQDDDSADASRSIKTSFAQHAPKTHPQHWAPLLQVWWSAKLANIKFEWNEFKVEMRVLIERMKEIRNETEMQKLVGMFSPFADEKKSILAASIVINILALAFPLLMLQLYDRILPHQSFDTLGLFAITVGVAVALESITRVARSYTTAWISARFEHKVMMEVAERALVEPLHEFERQGTGTVMENFKSISSLKYHYSGQTFQQLMDLPFTFLYLLIIFILNIWIGLLVTVGYGIFVYITWKMGRNDPELIKEQKTADLRRNNFLNETLSNVHTMKSMSMESLMLRRYERLQEGSARIMAKMTYAGDMATGIGNVFSPLMTTLVVALGAY